MFLKRQDEVGDVPQHGKPGPGVLKVCSAGIGKKHKSNVPPGKFRDDRLHLGNRSEYVSTGMDHCLDVQFPARLFLQPPDKLIGVDLAEFQRVVKVRPVERLLQLRTADAADGRQLAVHPLV